MPSNDDTTSDTDQGGSPEPRTTSPLAPGAEAGSPAPTSAAPAAPGPAADGDDDGAGETTSAFEQKVAEVVKVIRPAIQADEGDIFLRGADPETGVVSVELVGACITCPASSQTLKEGLERILKQRVDGVTVVEHVGEELIGAGDGTPVSL